MPDLNSEQLTALGDEQHVKLEITRGLPTWEAFPGIRHQKAVRRIVTSIKPRDEANAECGCFELTDIYIRFPDGSLKRPDIAIYCVEPADTDVATTELPQAVIEVISAGYEVKDLEINPPFYLAHGIQDVVIVDPRMALVWHHQQKGVTRYQSPTTLHLLCGCQVVV